MKKEKDSSPNFKKNKSHPFWQRFWLTFLVVSLAYAWYSFYTPSTDIKWDSNITSLHELTKSSKKNKLLFFTGKWCSPCRIMKRTVFADNEVEKIVNSKLIPVIIDIDKGETKELVKHYNIRTTPTTIIVDSQGEVLDYAVGKIEKKEFLKMLSNINGG